MMAENLPALWPHQERGINQVVAAVARGCRRICLCSPTGGGKTRMAAALAKRWVEESERVVFYTNRKLLVNQANSDFTRLGLEVGVRAAGELPEFHHLFQVASVQTTASRSVRTARWGLHDAKLVLVDEAHLNTGKEIAEIMARHLAAGAVVVGITATPIGLGELYDELVVAGVTSELRACGALARAEHYAASEPDPRSMSKPKKGGGQDYTEGEVRSYMMRPGIQGRVIDAYRRINPEQRPSILFAPGVAESLWFAEQFEANGIPAASIDGESIWMRGVQHKSSKSAREELAEASRCGDIKVVCNRFVLREGVDWPWLAHGIFATVFGSLQTYLQSGGRILRNHPSLGGIVRIQDHGGNWWRHGSLNEDRDWFLDNSPAMLSGLREDRLRRDPPSEPRRCHRCDMVVGGGSKRCAGCQAELAGRPKTRAVVQADGSLVDLTGDAFGKRRVERRDDTVALWRSMYWRMRHAKDPKTFTQALGLFARENFYWPPDDIPWMPVREIDKYRLVKDVPVHKLIADPEADDARRRKAERDKQVPSLFSPDSVDANPPRGEDAR